MVMVMCAVMVTFIVGMALLDGLPAGTHVSGNMITRDQSGYLAESGIIEALGHLREPPDYGEIWTGISDRSIDGTAGRYDVVVAQIEDEHYRITSTGYTPKVGGGVFSQTVSMDVKVEVVDGGFLMDKSVVLGFGGMIGDCVGVNGDVYVNGNVFLFGDIEGDLSASGIVNVGMGGEANSIQSNVGEVVLPTIDFDTYETYIYEGEYYDAMVMTADEFVCAGSEIDPQTEENPLGVIVVNGEVVLDNDMHIKHDCALVVRGGIQLNDNTLEVDGKEGYFGLLVEGDVNFGSDGELRVRKGPIYLNEYITSAGFGLPILNANAGLVSRRCLPMTFPGSIDIQNKPLEDHGVTDVKCVGTGSLGSRAMVITPLGYASGAE